MRNRIELKIQSYDRVIRDLDFIRSDDPDVRVGLTNGAFDLMHPGHIFTLNECAQRCDWLIVLVNSDESVRKLKGPERPVMKEQDRALCVASIEQIDQVCIWHEERITQALKDLCPEVWMKGRPYTLDTLDQGERQMADSLGISILFTPDYEGFSTTKRINS
jgi:rfaE bifunctional protein nucleotidyltransferase chain/domain